MELDLFHKLYTKINLNIINNYIINGSIKNIKLIEKKE